MADVELLSYRNGAEKTRACSQDQIKPERCRGRLPFIGLALLSILTVVLLIVMIIYIVKYNQLIPQPTQVKAGHHPKSAKLYGSFDKADYNSVVKYLLTEPELNLVPAGQANMSSNYIFDVDSYLPSKQQMLDFLDGKLSAPIRKAKVTLFMGADKPKSVRELLVWPVPNPTNHEDVEYPNGKKPTWQSRPLCPYVEGARLDAFLQQELDPLKPLFEAHYGNWKGKDCSTKCLVYGTAPRVIPGYADRTMLLFFHLSLDEFIDYYLRVSSLSLLVYTPGNGDTFAMRAVYYDDVQYQSVEELLSAYRNNSIANRNSQVYRNNKDGYGSPARHGPDMNPADLKPSFQMGQVQQRFSVGDNHVSWLGWEFDFHFRALSTFQLFNVAFNKERIIFELGLQDIVVIYTGEEPFRTFRNYWDAGWQLGTRISPLMRDYDCPKTAEYISWNVYGVGTDDSMFLKDSACVFEYTNSVPMRRHFSTDFSNTGGYRFRFSMPDTVLVFRQIVTVWNYDYMLDVEFHQNGVIEVKATSTGYIQLAHSTNIKFGYLIYPEAKQQALLHTHFFNFKVDVDVSGINNRFKTVDIGYETQINKWNPRVNTSYYVMIEHMRTTEQDAVIKYDFTKPKHLVIYNEHSRNGFNNYSRGYKIHSNSFAHPIYPDKEIPSAASWMRHQVAVTKVKDTERGTASYFTQGDPFDPVVSFADFQEDNESIVDEDLVTWVTLGMHHIPTAEDIPVTTAAGKVLSLCLMPYNYFEEDPSIWSRDAKLLTKDVV